MKKIKCETSNCEHNIKCVCTAGIISIGDNAKCLSKIKREGGQIAQSFADIEAGEDFYDEKCDCIVQCMSDCCFNEKGLCSCQDINVKDGVFSTKCKTKIPTTETK